MPCILPEDDIDACGVPTGSSAKAHRHHQPHRRHQQEDKTDVSGESRNARQRRGKQAGAGCTKCRKAQRQHCPANGGSTGEYGIRHGICLPLLRSIWSKRSLSSRRSASGIALADTSRL